MPTFTNVEKNRHTSVRYKNRHIDLLNLARASLEVRTVDERYFFVDLMSQLVIPLSISSEVLEGASWYKCLGHDQCLALVLSLSDNEREPVFVTFGLILRVRIPFVKVALSEGPQLVP